MSREKITPPGNIPEMQYCRYNQSCDIILPMIYHNQNGNGTCVVHVVSELANECLVRTLQNRHFFNILPSIKK